MGDAVNVTARLASAAGPGEVLVTLDGAQAGGLALPGLEQRDLGAEGQERTHVGRRPSHPVRVNRQTKTRIRHARHAMA